MDLKTRLSRLQSRPMRPAQATTATSELRDRLAQLRPQRLQAASTRTADAVTANDLADALDGKPVADGVLRIHRRVPLDGRLGAVALADVRAHPRLPGERAVHDRRQVYLDTETTGLSGGSGTVAFLIGIAVVNDSAIELTQFLMTRFAAETALLSALAANLTARDRLVSYNGKSYDLPLLQSRFRMQALPHSPGSLPHLDLLHPVRRLFGRHWPDCRLQTLERRLLGLGRVNDLPGSEAPAAWFDYLRHARAGRLLRTVEHNRQDILSLVVAHSVLARVAESPGRADLNLSALARWHGERDEAGARRLLEACPERLCEDDWRLLGHYYRRRENWDRAVAIWERLAADGCADSLERLAKYHEHVSGNLTAARRCCEALPSSAAREHRCRRIERKLMRRQLRSRRGDIENSAPDQ
jgi:uncharacterized protein YprB with RNaseH-like and TPR domain